LRVGRSKDWATGARWLLSSEGRTTLGNPRFSSYLVDDLLLDVEVELLLTEVCRQLLMGPPDVLTDPLIRTFAAALVRQCDLNEYAFSVSEEETLRRAALEPAIGSGSNDATAATLPTAMYVSVRDLLAKLARPADVEALEPEAFRNFVREELDHLREEREIAGSIPQHGEITDEVSRPSTSSSAGAPRASTPSAVE
jgi:hypothetical protein